MSKLTPIERFIAEIPSDRRRAYDLRQEQAGFKRVNVTVPEQHAEAIKLIARWLRNATPGEIETMREGIEESLRADFEMFDEWVAAGEPE